MTSRERFDKCCVDYGIPLCGNEEKYARIGWEAAEAECQAAHEKRLLEIAKNAGLDIWGSDHVQVMFLPKAFHDPELAALLRREKEKTS